MNLKPTRQTAIENLNTFIEENLEEYSRLRNFDFGPDKRSNTSCLSPYITHGVINEKEVISKSLEKFSFSKNEKFIQELAWRDFWQQIWVSKGSLINKDLKRPQEDINDFKIRNVKLLSNRKKGLKFSINLVGFDGTLKLKSETLIPNNLFKIIDKMPMSQKVNVL